ncbi:MAG: zinc ribbon domain-containing protein [Clostridia bacterium]|nr:zinc ribbon domain-containing protein [Clostridia bacterium]
MNCKNCGFEYGEQYDYCPNCGTPKADKQPTGEQPTMPEPVSLNPAADRIMNALKDSMFLVLCILMSVSCVMSIAAGSLPLINILITVFLWLTYADASKGFVNENHLRSVSGTVYASYVITNVACVMLIVGGVLFGAVFGFITSTPEFISELEAALSVYDFSEFNINISDIPQELWSLSGWILGFMFIFIAAIGLVINILGMRKIHRFAKSVYQGIMFQKSELEKPRAAKNWLLFFGICSAISAMTSLAGGGIVATLATGSSAASAIIASILIDKYLIPETYYTL